MNIEIFGIIAGTLTTGAFLPQVVKTVKTQSTSDLSWLWLIMMTVGVGSWTVYGFFLNSFSMVTANILTLLCLLIINFIKFKNG